MATHFEVDGKLPFLAHLQELRNRIIFGMVAICAAFIVTYSLKERIFLFLMGPFMNSMPPDSAFIFTGITEAFTTYIKISLVSALVLALPMILYQFWCFVSPGLYKHEKGYIYPLIIWGSLCFVAGVAFCYWLVLPPLYKFFTSYSSELLTPMPDLRAYMNLTLKMLVIFGLVFETPLVVYYLTKAGILDVRALSSGRRYVVLVMFVLSAVISTGSISGMILLAVTLWGLYEICAAIARLFGKKENVDEKV